MKIIFIFIIFFLSSCNHQSGQPEPLQEEAVYRKISAVEAKSMMEENNPYTLLDVRTEEEFQEIRIDGSILIPDYEIHTRIETEIPEKNTLILIYCRSGRRSALAANELVSMGYTKVYDFGGIENWEFATVSG